MGNPASAETPAFESHQLLRRIAGGDADAFETLMRQHNGRLFRVARAILKDDADAEDAVQDGYLDAYRHLATFNAQSSLSTWLTRIVVNRSLMKLRQQKRDRVVVPLDRPTEEGSLSGTFDAASRVADASVEPPIDTAIRAEVRRLIERRIDELPLNFRTVFVMCEVNDTSIGEAAGTLGIPAATVRTRLFRARALLRGALAQDLDAATVDVFGFAGERCDRIVTAVLETIRTSAGQVMVPPCGSNELS